ncbi:phosphate ABC transporter permease PstA [Haloferula sp. A504]|uniref:phosphate ABC transporter permease PstA n=1 Tax=Haloferula sp. A504 TaxID=3373601 RepID=UPI0031CB628C|nr:phosphate ABC transporter permease PstA [Verrucomicrobiaceae bacterium E54]
MAKPPKAFATTGRSRKGEPLVWLTALGLTLGVLMTLWLLGLVVYKGCQTFWPDRLQVFEVKTDSGTEKVAGYEVLDRDRRDGDGNLHHEVQLFRGNVELYGEKFVFLDSSSIVSREQADDLLLVERLAGGNVIGRAKAIELADGSRMGPEDPSFEDELEALIEVNEDRRDELRDVEKFQIGKNSKRIKELELKKRLIADGKVGGSIPEIDAELEKLQAEYEELFAEKVKIEELMKARHLYIEAVDGREIVISGESLLHVLRPNEVGFFGRLGEMLRRIWNFLTMDPREANTEGGVYPAIFGTVIMTIVMSLFVTPFGVIAAIYLREYAKQGPFVRAVRISVNNLAGVPSIVFGVFGLAFFIYFVGGVVDGVFFPNAEEPVYKSGGILWASLTLALLTVPVVIVATEEALAAVPRGVREAALACGASKWQAIQRVVLPASLPGILTGVILAMARGAGEVAPLMLVGVVKSAPDLPIDVTAPFIHPERQFMHLGFHIYDLGFQSPDSEAAKPMVFATTLLLITIVVVMNLAAIIIRNRLRKKYATSSF